MNFFERSLFYFLSKFHDYTIVSTMAWHRSGNVDQANDDNWQWRIYRMTTWQPTSLIIPLAISLSSEVAIHTVCHPSRNTRYHYCDVIMGAVASRITSLTILYSTVYSDADQRKHQSSASLAYVRGIHRGPVNSPRKRPVTRKMFPFDDVIMSKFCRILIGPIYMCRSFL